MDSSRPTKPSFSRLRDLQREFMHVRWEAIKDRKEDAFYSKNVDTMVVANALGHEGDDSVTSAHTTAARSGRHNLPSHAAGASPLLSSGFLFMDALSCGLLSRRRKFSDFGDGMISLNVKKGFVEFYPESVASYRSRRLTIAIALIYVWLFFMLIIFWIWRLSTGAYPNLELPPYGSGTIHLAFCLSVVVAYVVGTTVVPRFNTVGLRDGSLPSLLPLVLQTSNSQFMSSYAWSSRYVDLVRSLSGVLHDCWLDVRELTPGDRVTQEIAHAAATARCLVIFFAYEYLRSVNCTYEVLTALRHRGSPQQTIILLEALDNSVAPVKGGKVVPLTAKEAARVRDILLEAIPGLRVAHNTTELIDLLDKHCVRATDEAGIADTIAWWALHGIARTNRVDSSYRVVPPLLHGQLRNYCSLNCSLRRRRKGEVGGGFAVISGDGSAIHVNRPPDKATLTMVVVILLEVCVYLHMFFYCVPAVDKATVGSNAFAKSCLTESTFLYTISILGFIMVVFQYFVGMKADPANLHDQILLPLNVAAHAGGVGVPDDAPLRQTFSFAKFLTPRVSQQRHVSLTKRSVDTGFWVVFVTSDHPCDLFAKFAATMGDFLMNHAAGIVTKTIPFSALPAVARRLTIYVFLLDNHDSVDLFYRRVHSAPPVTRSSLGPDQSPRIMDAWPTSQILVACQADVLKQKKPAPGVVIAPPADPVPAKYATSFKSTKSSTAARASSQQLSPDSVSVYDEHVEHSSIVTVSPDAPQLRDTSFSNSERRGGNAHRPDEDSAVSPRNTARSRGHTARAKIKITRLPGPSRPARDPPVAAWTRSSPALLRAEEADPQVSASPSSTERAALKTSAERPASSAAKSTRELKETTRTRSAPPANAKPLDKRSTALRMKWRRAILNVMRILKRKRLNSIRTTPVVLDLPVHDEAGNLSQHLKTALFEYLLIMTGSKNGVDPYSPYDSLADALLDSVGRKVGSVLEAPQGSKN